MVVVVVGGYDAAMARADADASQAAKALARFDLVAISGSIQDAQAGRMRMGAAAPEPAMSDEVLGFLRQSKAVGALMECCQARVESRSKGPMFQYAMYRPGELMTSFLLGTHSPQAPYPMLEGS
jgi:hypothetical protein